MRKLSTIEKCSIAQNILNGFIISWLMMGTLLAVGLWFENIHFRNWYLVTSLSLDGIYGFVILGYVIQEERFAAPPSAEGEGSK